MRLLSLAPLLLLALTSCGSVGEPLPPLLRIPERIQDFQARQVSTDVLASWTAPRLTTEGASLQTLDRFEVFALDIASGPPPADQFPDLAREVLSLPAGDPGERIDATLPVADRIGKRTMFAVRVVSARGKYSGFSDFAVLDILRPAPPPNAPSLRVEPDGVRIQWEAVAAASGYLVERRLEGESDFALLAHAENADFLDRAVQWEQRHDYRIRAEIGGGGQAVAGDPSEPASVTPLDRFPPAVPDGIRAIATPQSVELAWSASDDPDLSGYQLRRQGGAALDVFVEIPSYSDRDVLSGQTYRYSVATVDLKGNESEPSDPVEITVR